MGVMKLWDRPTRVFHWSLVVLGLISWWTAEYSYYEWHEKSGLLLASLIMFRILWGFWGGRTARFAHFIKGPQAVIHHVGELARRQAEPSAGHNAVGAYAVLLMLLLILVQIVTGLFSQADYGVFLGPWADLVSTARSEAMTSLHHQIFTFLQIIVGLHIVAVLLYWALLKQNLIGPMISGRKAGLSAPSVAEPSLLRLGACIFGGFALGWGGVGAVEAVLG